MNAYKDYMDSVEVSDTVHQKLTQLSAPAAKPVWRKYGVLAAALVLALGAGAFGAARLMKRDAVSSGSQSAAGGAQAEAACAPDIADIAPEDCEPAGDAMKTIGGYEVQGGDNGPDTVVSYYMLPYIAYGEQTGGVTADYSLVPPDGGFREATREDFLSILGCDEAALSDHLGWDGCILTGNLGFNADGSPACAYLFGESDAFFFEVELCPDRLPPQCCIVIGMPCTTTDVWGVEVTGVKNVGRGGDGERGIYFDKSLRTEFLAHNVGVRCTMYGTDEDALAVLMSRFVRWAVLEGLDLSGISADGAQPIWEETAAAGPGE